MAASVSILLLWIVLLKVIRTFTSSSKDARFNPSSLDCTSERRGGYWYSMGRGFVSILLLWIVLLKALKDCLIPPITWACFNPSSLDCTSERPLAGSPVPIRNKFQSFFSGLYFWKKVIIRIFRRSSRVSILLLWIVLLKEKLMQALSERNACFNPSSLDCTSESSLE